MTYVKETSLELYENFSIKCLDGVFVLEKIIDKTGIYDFSHTSFY